MYAYQPETAPPELIFEMKTPSSVLSSGLPRWPRRPPLICMPSFSLASRTILSGRGSCCTVRVISSVGFKRMKIPCSCNPNGLGGVCGGAGGGVFGDIYDRDLVDAILGEIELCDSESEYRASTIRSHTRRTNRSNPALVPANSAGPSGVSLDTKMPSSFPLKGVEFLPPAIDNPKPADVLTILTSNNSSFPTISPSTTSSLKLKYIKYIFLRLDITSELNGCCSGICLVFPFIFICFTGWLFIWWRAQRLVIVTKTSSTCNSTQFPTSLGRYCNLLSLIGRQCRLFRSTLRFVRFTNLPIVAGNSTRKFSANVVNDYDPAKVLEELEDYQCDMAKIND
ncbi:hypothetical protein AGLY_015959 [Aphis glycines]|uniref:Uncharacterized protein n=1 Tax=Aphis glycines TaxID=307491 RepID=A0A6G0T0H6_APHGL|nr:hypothetical protein AGLY_015959 [Aphis glycines]